MGLERKFFRDQRHGKLLGVCAGFEDYFGIDGLWFRLGVIVLIFVGFIFIVPIYFLIAIITDKKPPHMYEESLDRIFSGPGEATLAGDATVPASRKGIEQ